MLKVVAGSRNSLGREDVIITNITITNITITRLLFSFSEERKNGVYLFWADILEADGCREGRVFQCHEVL